ncbi:MAG: hypothetical protein ABI306_07860 [Caulobacteraceae bacterium]
MTTLAGGFGGLGIFAGVDDIAERHLGIADIGTSQPRFRHLSAARRLSGRRPRDFDAAVLIEEVLALLEAKWRASIPARTPSVQNWRFEKQLWIAPHNTSGEKTLEKAIARVSGDAWANQVPTASGLINGSNDKHRNLDLVFRRQAGGFELIELKYRSDTPLFAAVEALLYGVLYLFSQLHYPRGSIAQGYLLDAPTAHLQVLAPAEYYLGYNFDWLQTEITRGLERVVADRRNFPATMDFAFTTFPAKFTWPCPDDTLRLALENRQPAVWSA